MKCFERFEVIGSAIPMWEFLSRKEKMSRLYKLFSQQVTQFCADSSRPDCNKNFLITGIRNLAEIDDNILDKLDPYQRSAREIIWRALIGTNRFSSRTSQDIKGNYFPTNDLLIGNDDSETNTITEESVSTNDYIHVGPYLIGPMVTRVFPDGRPVPDNYKRFRPRDDDIDELKYTVVLPSISDIETKFDKTAYRNKVLNNDRKNISPSRFITLRRISIEDHDGGYH
ncbi:PREDICTED: rhythmically expressed gene 5 protein isoform X2 [Polistes dominula]|uniref:Rhythmically expressed gene 5 protein isoform X2 n=1 Tax=Polistes dominula TaxID=743375 RepID=A0ABM1I3N7_POLDO|nr:PREDICTED: rhythmically expressed gene 5 protein isoform X2 [Polistes dominula]